MNSDSQHGVSSARLLQLESEAALTAHALAGSERECSLLKQRCQDLELQLDHFTTTGSIENPNRASVQKKVDACQPGAAPACQPGVVPACQPGAAPACQPGAAPACHSLNQRDSSSLEQRFQEVESVATRATRALGERLKSAEAEAAMKSRALAEAQSDLLRLTAMQRALVKQFDELQGRVDDLNTESGAKVFTTQGLQQECLALKERLVGVESASESATRALADAEAKVTKLEGQVREAGSLADATANALTQANRDRRRLGDRVRELEAEAFESRSTSSAVHRSHPHVHEHAELAAANETLLENCQQLQQELKQRESHAACTAQQFQQQIKQQEACSASTAQQLQQQEAHAASTAQALAALKSEHHQLSASHQSLAQHCARLEHQLESSGARESASPSGGEQSRLAAANAQALAALKNEHHQLSASHQSLAHHCARLEHQLESCGARGLLSLGEQVGGTQSVSVSGREQLSSLRSTHLALCRDLEAMLVGVLGEAAELLDQLRAVERNGARVFVSCLDGGKPGSDEIVEQFMIDFAGVSERMEQTTAKAVVRESQPSVLIELGPDTSVVKEAEERLRWSLAETLLELASRGRVLNELRCDNILSRATLSSSSAASLATHRQQPQPPSSSSAASLATHRQQPQPPSVSSAASLATHRQQPQPPSSSSAASLATHRQQPQPPSSSSAATLATHRQQQWGWQPQQQLHCSSGPTVALQPTWSIHGPASGPPQPELALPPPAGSQTMHRSQPHPTATPIHGPASGPSPYHGYPQPGVAYPPPAGAQAMHRSQPQPTATSGNLSHTQNPRHPNYEPPSFL
eukprot:gene4925-34696_t